MEERQLYKEFLSILSESHPGLTFEEYRDSCVFLLYYHFLTIKYKDEISDDVKLEAFVRMALRGRLQIDSFLQMMEQASEQLKVFIPQPALTELTFYQRLQGNIAPEKQKSLARFIRKMIKKLYSWKDEEILSVRYGEYFQSLMEEFAKQKKETYLSEKVIQLYEMFLKSVTSREEAALFQPEFQFGILINRLTKDHEGSQLYGYEDRQEYLEILNILCMMEYRPISATHLHTKDHWNLQEQYNGQMDGICIYMPEGVEGRGELRYLLNMLSYLKDDGEMAAILPSALLYREGRDSQIRKYLTEEKNWLDTVMILPDHIHDTTGQDEILLYFKKKRIGQTITFFDCSESSFEEEELEQIRSLIDRPADRNGYCINVDLSVIRENDFNLNIPRYISKNLHQMREDLETRKQRISEIEQELAEIEEKMHMYLRDLDMVIH